MDRDTSAVVKDSKDVMKSAVPESEMKKAPIVSSSGQSPASIVYVRRKVEPDSAKSIKPPVLPSVTSSSHVAAESAVPQGPVKLDWEDRYQHLQMLLNKLNDSDQTDHVQMLWSLSSAELSKHAVDLEKRSIHFSLEEAREMQRVAALNVLGRSVNSVKSTSNDGE